MCKILLGSEEVKYYSLIKSKILVSSKYYIFKSVLAFTIKFYQNVFALRFSKNSLINKNSEPAKQSSFAVHYLYFKVDYCVASYDTHNPMLV